MSLQDISVGAAPALALCAMALFASCGDDSRPDREMWQEAQLLDAPDQGGLFSVAFSPTRGLAAGVEVDSSGAEATNVPYLAAWNPDGTWTRVTDAPLPSGSLLSAVGFAPSGDAVAAGVVPASTGFVLDERGGWSRHDFLMGGRVFATGANVVRLAGSTLAYTVLLKSTAPDVWNAESPPFPTLAGEKGISDIVVGNDVFVACGWDDGGDGSPEFPKNLLFRDDGDGWERLDTPCGGCGNREFRAVALAPGGGILLGGAITDFSAGAPDLYRAFLLLRSPTGDWVEIILSDSGMLDRVNDILVTPGGDLYLACGIEDSFIMHPIPVTDPPQQPEATLPHTRIESLAEAPDGTIWAAGAVRTGIGAERRPALWRRVE